MLKPAHCLTVALLAAGLVACSPVETRSTVADAGRVKVAGAGDVVLSMEMRESLPNAVGGADIFGRTRPAGRIEVRYLGADPSGVLRFARRDITAISNETTMNRVAVANTYGTVNRTPYGASFSGTTISQAPGQTQMIPAGTIPLTLDPRQGRVLPVNGAQIEVLGVTAAGIQYRVLAP